MEYDLTWLLDGTDELCTKEKTTFLQVLGRKYDEDLISRVLVYIMNKNSKFVFSLLNEYSNGFPFNTADCEILIYPEKSMGKGRADIFAIIKNNGKIVATLTVENKIFSYEHDDQTQTYYNWVYGQQEYKDAYINAFFYLRPSFNSSLAVCKQYKNITYADIKRLIGEGDYITDDFKKHIDHYLGESTMDLTEKQLEIIENYEKLQSTIDEAAAIFATKKNGLIDRVKSALSEKDPEILYDVAANSLGIYSLKLYKDKWYKKDEYYFFAELSFENGKMDKVIFQKVAKEYPKKSTEKYLQDFLRSDLIPIHSENGRMHIWGLVDKYDSSLSWTEEEWQKGFVEKAVESLQEYVVETDEMVERFLKYIQSV